MKQLPEFTAQDLTRKPFNDYANYKGENRVFRVFITSSPRMMKLRENRNFVYESRIYFIAIKTLRAGGRAAAVQFDCLKENNAV